jgi:hypothetical protein
MTIKRVLWVTLVALLFAIATRVPVDTDTWWHLRSGEHTLTDGMIYTDPFSHTFEGQSWINHSWGSQVIMHGLYQVAGDAGLALFTALLATGGMVILYPVCVGNAYLRAFVIILGGVTAAVFWSARPQMFSFFFSGVTLFLLYQYKRSGRDWLWAFVPMMAIWGNLHAGFSIGFIFWGGFIAGEILGNVFDPAREDRVTWRGVRKLILVGGVAVVALLVNPYGFQMLQVPFETVSIGALREFIQEWQSPNFQGRETWPFIIMLVLLIGAVGASARRLDWTDFVLVSGTLFMALLYGRNIAVFAVIAPLVLSVHTDSMLKSLGYDFQPRTRVTKRQSQLNMGLAGMMVLVAVVNFAGILSPETVARFQRQNLPVDAADYIASAQPPGPMFNSYNYGGYLMWALPDYPVYVDGRTDLYGSDFLESWLQTALGNGDWRAVLNSDTINLVVVERGSGLATNLADEPGWSQVYPPADLDDERVVIYTRDDPIGD